MNTKQYIMKSVCSQTDDI